MTLANVPLGWQFFNGDEHVGRSPRFSIGATRAALAMFAALSLLFSFWISVTAPFDHDENQHVAGAALLSRYGLLPYRDFGYFHMPNLVFVNALLFKFSDHLLLTARLFSMTCGWLTALLCAATAYLICSNWRKDLAIPYAIVSALFFLSSPLFMATNGRATNHDLSLLLALASIYCLLRAGTDVGRSVRWLAAAGAWMGLAVGTRLTFAPALALLPLAVWTVPSIQNQRRRAITIVLSAAGLALLPSIVLFLRMPAQFYFGNLVYPQLNTSFRIASDYGRAMSPAGKLVAFAVVLMRGYGTAALLLSVLVAAVLNRRSQPSSYAVFATRVCLLMLGGMLIGSFAPSPLFTEYFYAPVAPTVILLVALAARLDAAGRRPKQLLLLSSLLCATSMIAAALNCLPKLRTTALNDFRSWPAEQAHRIGLQIRQATQTGRVLTFAPIFALEGHRKIYPKLATGPFSERAADQLSEADELTDQVMDLDDCKEVLTAHQPAAVLVGVEHSLDARLAALADQAGYDPQPLNFENKQLTLLVRPLH